MSALNESTAKRIAKLIRMFGSSFENERHVALAKMRRVLDEERLTFSDLAVVIENCNGEIEQLKYSDADMANVADRMKERGEQTGYEKAKREMTAPPEFYDDLGEPRWYEMAMFCQDHKARLRDDWERSFVDDMPNKLISYGNPTPKQAKKILGLFVRLGGKVPPEVRLRYI